VAQLLDLSVVSGHVRSSRYQAQELLTGVGLSSPLPRPATARRSRRKGAKRPA
jgi:hypothetical protein